MEPVATQTTVLGVKWVAVAPFELKLGPSGSYGRAASVGTPPRAQNAKFEPKLEFDSLQVDRVCDDPPQASSL